MNLTLKAIRYKGNLLVSPLKATFGEDGGTIGRSSTNHYVLADEEKIVSNQHAVIQFEEGFYYYLDKSLNGTLFTKPDRWIHHEKVSLQDQQTLFIGDYEVVAAIGRGPSENGSCVTPGSIFSIFGQTSDDDNEAMRDDHPFFDGQPDLIEKETNKPCVHGQAEQAFETGPPPAIEEIFTPPLVTEPSKQESNLPRDISLADFFSDADHAREDMDRDNNKAATLISEIDLDHSDDTANDRLLKAFLKTVGLEDIEVMPQEKALALMHTIGNVFKELIDGLMTILRGRSELKSQLRVSMTVIKKAENNPLKFSPTVEEALKAMLIATPVGFLTPVDAVREGFDDIKNHQLAITAGLQAALASTLKLFDPEILEKKFDEGLILQKKTKCWNEYRQTYADIVEQAFEAFFGEAFVRAYEAQMDKLRVDHKKAG